jgi:hypothetical protein
MNFWFWAEKKHFGKNFGQVGTFYVLIGRFPPFYAFVKFKKSGIFSQIFSIFGHIWQLFFSKCDLSKIGPRTIKKWVL